MFWIDMKSPGIECKSIHQMSGARGFNEVFFTDVRVKDSQRLGALNDGWKVSIITLMNERASVGGSGGSPGGIAMSALKTCAENRRTRMASQCRRTARCARRSPTGM